MREVGGVASLPLCRLSGEPEFYSECDGKPLVIFKQGCEDGTITLVDSEHSGRCVAFSVTMDTRTIGPLCVPLGLGFDFPERWQANLGWGGHGL